MGIDMWCSRAWDGSLYLLVALTGAAGCTQPLVAPGSSPSVSSSPETPLVPATVVPTTVVPATLVSEFPDDAPQQPLCGDPLLGRDFLLDDSGLPTRYVDAASDDSVRA